MKRGFTLIEVMIASAIGAIVMTAVFVMIFGVWSLARESANDLQTALHARQLRMRLLYSATEKGGLLSATEVKIWGGTHLLLSFNGGAQEALDIAWYELNTGADVEHKKSSSAVMSNVDECPGVRYVYTAATFGDTVYRERMLVPLFGGQLPDADDHGGMTLNSELFKGTLEARSL